MKKRKLGSSDLMVSPLCLGSMTWGEQNSEKDAHKQMDAALAAGINFIDTAELYPVPPRAQTQGLSETFIGNWLKRRKCRNKIILASKVAGRSSHLTWIRPGGTRLNRRHITEACEASLKRLGVECIDLYQIHWPDRLSAMMGYDHLVHSGVLEMAVTEREYLEVLRDLIRAGKIRHIGISNETPRGLANYLRFAKDHKLPRVVSVQSPYNLLNRGFELDLADKIGRARCGLLAYSPLAFGVLTGKYLDGAKPPKARLTLFAHQFDRYRGLSEDRAVYAYVRLARDFGFDPAQMALAYVVSRPFVTSTIIGATTLKQLESDIQSLSLSLSETLIEELDSVYAERFSLFAGSGGPEQDVDFM